MSLRSFSVVTSATPTAAVFTPVQDTSEVRLKPAADALVGGADRQAWPVASGAELVLTDLKAGDAVWLKTASGASTVEILATNQ